MQVRTGRQLTWNVPSGYARAVAVTYSPTYPLRGGARSAIIPPVSYARLCHLVSARLGVVSQCAHRNILANLSAASSDDEPENSATPDQATQGAVHRSRGRRPTRGMLRSSCVFLHFLIGC